MCPLQGRWSSTGPTGAGDGARQPSGPSTDLDDVDAVQRVDEEEARGPVHLVPALAGRGQLLVVGCK